jgi:hypothetical protein
MQDIDKVLDRLANRHKGLVVREHALAEGISEPTLDNRVRAGILIPLYEGIYRHAAVPFTQELRDLAAVLACGPGSVLSHRSAAARHRFPNVRRGRPEVTTPNTDLPRHDPITRHRTNRLPACEVTTRDGIPITTKGRTAMDFCAVTPLWISQEVIVEAVITKLLDPTEVFAVLDRSGGRGCRGCADLRVIACGFDDLEKLESMLELDVARALDRSSLPTFVRQHEMTCADGRHVRLDFAIPDIRFAIEANGKRWHDTPARKKRTRERLASIEGSAWEVLTVGWKDTPRDYLAAAEAAIVRLSRRAA